MNTRDMVYVALFAAIMAVLGLFPPITLPVVGVPITAQSMGVMIAGSVLGAKRGGLAVLIFLILVAVGVPILAGGRGGFSIFLGPGGGFLFSWPIAAFVIGMLVEKWWDRLNMINATAINIVGGIVLIYAAGIPWVAVAAEIGIAKAFTGSMGFVPGDIVKALIAAFIAVTMRRAYPIIKTA